MLVGKALTDVSQVNHIPREREKIKKFERKGERKRIYRDR